MAIRSLPVMSKVVYAAAKREIHNLLETPTAVRGFLPLLPPVEWNVTSNQIAATPTAKQLHSEWCVLLYLPSHHAYLLKNNALHHYYNIPKSCPTDGCSPKLCAVYSGTILLAEQVRVNGEDNEWSYKTSGPLTTCEYVTDAIMISGRNLTALPREQRMDHARKLRDTCFPTLQMIDEMQDATQSRVYPLVY